MPYCTISSVSGALALGHRYITAFWHTPPSKEGHPRDDRHKDAWSDVLLAALMVGLLLGGLLMLTLTLPYAMRAHSLLARWACR